MPSTRLIGIGAFVVGGLALFAVGLFLIGERRMLFEDQFEIYTEFANLSGVQSGSQVTVAGMAAGEVVGIVPPPGPSGKFRLKLRVRERLHPLVRTDSVATVRTEGIVGGRFLQIVAGSEVAPEAPSGSTIPSQEPFDVAALLDQISETVTNLNATIVNVKTDIEGVLRVIATAGADADALIRDVGGDVKGITRSGNQIAADVEAMVRDVRAGRGTIGRLVNDDEMYERAKAIAEDAEEAVRNLREATAQANEAVRRLSGKEGAIEGMSADLRRSLDRANSALTNIDEATEALKHNWFFSGYFKRRGYFNLSDISPAQYLEGALEQNDRVPLRIWLNADVLFTTGPDGRLTISDGGKARLDSAMTEFLEYTGPLMVEGYATEGPTVERVVASRNRARTAREYLIERFDLDPANIGTMPLGSRALGSPAESGWDGIALAIFVERRAIQSRRR
ncbi:MAG: MlaD family protein [Vicinamibacterales bacterium]